MSLFQQKQLDAFVSRLPGVSFVAQWDSHVIKVADKVFVVFGSAGGSWTTAIVVKVTEESFEILTALPGVQQAPYFAKRKWVAITDDAPLSDDDLRHYIMRSYELVAAGLTKKRRLELGIALPIDV